jgi:hypothetical protein
MMVVKERRKPQRHQADGVNSKCRDVPCRDVPCRDVPCRKSDVIPHTV